MMTGVGVILGTAADMAPEQARGKAVDKRADIWAFGCVLYEMLTGGRALATDEVSDTLAMVLMKEPDWARLPVDFTGRAKNCLCGCQRGPIAALGARAGFSDRTAVGRNRWGAPSVLVA